MAIRVILLDLDGTLLTDDLTVSDQNRDALTAAQALGIQVILASGRPVSSLRQFVRYLSACPYVIASNGACVVNVETCEVLYSEQLSVAVVRSVLGIARGYGLSACVYTPSEWFVESINDDTITEVSRSNTEPVVAGFVQLPSPIIKLLLLGPLQALAQCEERFSEFLTSEIEWFRTYPEYLEVICKGASKGRARDYLLNQIGIPLSAVMAIGDGVNDLSMLKGVGISVAVANAKEVVRQQAEYLVPCNNDDGVAFAVRTFILRRLEEV